MKRIFTIALAAAMFCSCSEENKNVTDFDPDYHFRAELTTQTTEFLPDATIQFGLNLKDVGPKASNIKMTCITSNGSPIKLNGQEMEEQTSMLAVKNGDVITYEPVSLEGSFILTFFNERNGSDRYEVVVDEIEDDYGNGTGVGYIKRMRPLYTGL